MGKAVRIRLRVCLRSTPCESINCLFHHPEDAGHARCLFFSLWHMAPRDAAVRPGGEFLKFSSWRLHISMCPQRNLVWRPEGPRGSSRADRALDLRDAWTEGDA